MRCLRLQTVPLGVAGLLGHLVDCQPASVGPRPQVASSSNSDAVVRGVLRHAARCIRWEAPRDAPRGEQ
eukprot:10900483-Alexandrium_andersonii.AAC.1